MSRPLALLGALALCAAVGAAPASAATRAPVARIAAGVSAGGVDLSGLTVLQAAAKLKATVTPVLQTDVTLGAAGRPFRLRAATAKIELNATRTAQAALTALPPGAVAGSADAVPLVVQHSHGAVKAFAERVARAVQRRPRNATGHIGLRRITIRRARVGHRLDVAATRKLVDAALDDPTAPKVLHQRLSRWSPAVNANDLRRRWSTVITVDKSAFKLRLFKGLKVVKSYPVAVGQPAYPTPSGLFAITSKQVNPTWSVPNSPWAGELQGTTVEGGSAANPLKARWMGIANGVGIHGTGEDYSIGSAASHGCIRMHVADVIALFERVPVGTPVLLQ
jgi:lipoprotein-anchoring transpeptidase ErfK/SrfK